jgi:hypothetical protein
VTLPRQKIILNSEPCFVKRAKVFALETQIQFDIGSISIDNPLKIRIERRWIHGKSGEGDLKSCFGERDLRGQTFCRPGI